MSTLETITVMSNIMKQIYIEAPPDVVYDFLTSPEKLVRWMGILADRKELGERRFTAEDVAIRAGQVEQLLNSKVVFRYEVNAMGKSARCIVEIELERRGNGTCVRLTHKESPRLKRKFRKRIGKSLGSSAKS
jgi:carbon monoxide dehydrogenase subunit G